jgi:hypothetical protein
LAALNYACALLQSNVVKTSRNTSCAENWQEHFGQENEDFIFPIFLPKIFLPSLEHFPPVVGFRNALLMGGVTSST